MRRLFNLVLIVGMLAGAAYTFHIKRLASLAADELAGIERDIKAEHATIEVLEADWSYLTQPDRLQELTVQHAERLQLEPIAVEQLIRVEELPNKPINFSPYEGGDVLNGYAGVGSSTIQ